MAYRFWRQARRRLHNGSLSVGGEPVTRTISRLAAACLLAGLIASPASAQESGQRPFCADRPGKGSPTCTLDPGVFQAEAGFDYSHFDQAGVEAEEFGYGAMTLRLSLTDSLEGQILWTPYTVARETVGGLTDDSRGSGDLGVSLRQNLLNPDGSGASVALQMIVTAPTGADGIGAGVWEGSLMLPASFELTEETALTGMVEWDWVGDAGGGGHHSAWSGVVGIEHGLGELTLAGELWVQRDDDPSKTLTQASAGVQLMWTPASLHDLQFDVGVDFGLNEDTPDVALGVGVAKRF